MTIEVLLVDDHAVVREGYRRLLEQTEDIRVLAEAGNGEDAYRLFCELRPRVVVMDISLPRISGIEVTRRMVARDTGARVLVFSMHEDVVFASRALAAGARGYIAKSSAPEVLVEAIRRIATGQSYVDHAMAQRLALQRVGSDPDPVSVLTEREFEVFRLLAQGQAVADIAGILNLTPKTVANHQSALRQKLGVDNAAQLVRLAARHGLIGDVTFRDAVS
ncbi:MAG: response regulator transcription factor [Rhodocyclaceae bacterium]|nr:response regulator transcription factor [Rhodocyclaceae bacterium]